MQAVGYNNDYLANDLSPKEFARYPERYSYLLPIEEQPIVKTFDNICGAKPNNEAGVCVLDRSNLEFSVSLVLVRYKRSGQNQALE